LGEISDLIGIYGEIDDAVAEEPALRARVARLLPIYGDGDPRWFRDFNEWAKERAGSEESPFPSFKEALQDLSEHPAEGRMRARRLLAIAAALRAFPELRESHNRGLVVAALRTETRTEGEDEADQLLELLAANDPRDPTEEAAPPDDPDVWWQRLLEAAQDDLRDPEGIGHRPCTGRLVNVPGSGSVATLRTEWETGVVSFADAIKFLKPVNWPFCNGFWCEMEELEVLPNGVHRYHEVVSADCANKAHTWTIQAELDFSFRQLPGVAITDYGLSPGHPRSGDDVLVDEGTLVVQQVGPAANARLRIITTKRVEFARYFTPEALAMLMCVLGYASVVEDLVLHCARLGEGGTAFPGHAPAKGVHPDCGPVVTELAYATKECIDDFVETFQTSSTKMAEGRYSADDLVRDMANLWVRSVRDGARVLDRGVRSARMAARTRPPDP